MCVNSSFSDTLPVISGVPQGSVLGLFLFVVYIDDITNLVCTSRSANSSDVFLYADNAKLFSHNAAQLQCDFDSLASWLLHRQLSLSPSKCQHLAIAKNLCNVPSKFFIGIEDASCTDTVIDLGINISHNLSPHLSHSACSFTLCLSCVTLLFFKKCFNPIKSLLYLC